MKRMVILVAVGLLPAFASGLTFTDYGSGTTSEIFLGGATWQMPWGQGPWTWYTSDNPTLLGASATAEYICLTTGPADIDADLVARLPISGELHVMAYDATEALIGSMVLTGTGTSIIDLNASRVHVDPERGMWLAPFGGPDHPQALLALEEATGIYADMEQIGDWELYWSGWYAAPLIEGMALQDNVFYVLGGKAPLIGGISEFALTGEYIPEPATLTLLGLGGLGVLARRRR